MEMQHFFNDLKNVFLKKIIIECTFKTYYINHSVLLDFQPLKNLVLAPVKNCNNFHTCQLRTHALFSFYLTLIALDGRMLIRTPDLASRSHAHSPPLPMILNASF